ECGLPVILPDADGDQPISARGRRLRRGRGTSDTGGAHAAPGRSGRGHRSHSVCRPPCKQLHDGSGDRHRWRSQRNLELFRFSPKCRIALLVSTHCPAGSRFNRSFQEVYPPFGPPALVGVVIATGSLAGNVSSRPSSKFSSLSSSWSSSALRMANSPGAPVRVARVTDTGSLAGNVSSRPSSSWFSRSSDVGLGSIFLLSSGISMSSLSRHTMQPAWTRFL